MEDDNIPTAHIANGHQNEFDVPPAKRQRLDNSAMDDQQDNSKQSTAKPNSNFEKPTGPMTSSSEVVAHHNDTIVDTRSQQGIAPIKAEYVLSQEPEKISYRDDDEAEAAKDGQIEPVPNGKGRGKKEKKQRGQNKNRKFGIWGDKLSLCSSRTLYSEFSPAECKFGATCRMEHDLRKYLSEGKVEDLTTFDGLCPSLQTHDACPMGWKCRFAKSHSKEIDHEDGRKELILTDKIGNVYHHDEGTLAYDKDMVNVVNQADKISLNRRKVALPKSELYIKWLETIWNTEMERKHNRQISSLPVNQQETASAWNKLTETETEPASNGVEAKEVATEEEKLDNRASYLEPPLRPSEKRRLYYGSETPILAPLTTQGNLPYRRLCISLGAQATFSEMAVGMPLLEGQRSEWALLKSHLDEAKPPSVSPNASSVVQGYENSKDLKYGIQVTAAKPWIAVKTAEVLNRFCWSVRAIDLNCGCPIDMIYKSGAGSALLDQPSKLEKILRGMNLTSGEIPITAKIRTGTRDNKPTAVSLVERLVLGSKDAQEVGMGPCGVAAITLHGRSRQQRYSRKADWNYIAEVAATIADIRKEEAARADTISEADARDLPNGGRVLFVGNGDVYSHVDYNNHFTEAQVDGVMVGRGALIKPWIFEEIAANQYLDKSATERLEYIRQFVRYGLDCWGSDEMGVGTTRRFLLEWLSFSCRYIPVGILEHLPPQLNERPPPYRGRNELETLLSSPNYRDWIKISEMFLGKAHEGFQFVPKHKSSSYETEG